MVFLPACSGGHYFDLSPTPIPPTPTLTPTATMVPPTPTVTPSPTRTPLIIPTPQRQAATPSAATTATSPWQDGGSLRDPRGAHTATLLADGSVLAVGGLGSTPVSYYGSLASAERYYLQARSWRPAGAMAQARAYHTATLLPNGLVLVVGGEDDERYLATAELYDPATDRWLPTGALATPRSSHTATLLPDGSVLVIGGMFSPDGLLPEDEDEGYRYTATAERYDPATGTWQPAGSLLQTRAAHTATPLPGGEILIVGEALLEGDEYEDSLSAERFDPQTGTSRPAASLTALHYVHTATSLPDGRVLVVGDGEREAEVYDPNADRWQAAGRLGSIRYGFTSTLLPSGLVLVIGGRFAEEAAELFTPHTGSATPITQPDTLRSNHTATLLTDGSVLVVGGSDYASDEPFLATTDRYLPAQDQGSTPRQPGEYRANFTTWPQRTLASATLRQVADPTGATYRVQLSKNYGYVVMPLPERTRFTNFSLEVTLDYSDSEAAAVGVYFRSQGLLHPFENSYLLQITPDGAFGLARVDGEGTWHSVQPMIASGAIRFSAVNRLRVTCEGDTISIAINDQAVGRYHAAITTPGQVGLFAQNWGSDPLDVVFSQLRVVPLP